MSSMSARFKSKKAFTLVEMIAVMVIMAIAAAIVLPNISGIISRTEESMYESRCVEAVSYVRLYTNMLTLGHDVMPYETADGSIENYNITNPTGLTSALNEYNLETDYQYYVLEFDDTSVTNDPTSTITNLVTKGKIKKDVMITVILTASTATGRTTKYALQGFWYYSYSMRTIVYTYYSPKKRGEVGFKKLTAA